MSLLEVKSSEARFKDSILELQEVFSHLDRLGSEGASGSLSAEKVGEAIAGALGVRLDSDQLRDVIASVDLNESGDIQFNEFLKMMDAAKADAESIEAEAEAAAQAANADPDAEESEEAAAAREKARLQLEADYVMTRDDIKAIFLKFDADGDGFISQAELKAMLAAQGEKYADDEIHAMVSSNKAACSKPHPVASAGATNKERGAHAAVEWTGANAAPAATRSCCFVVEIHLVDPSNSGLISYQSFVRLMLSPDE